MFKKSPGFTLIELMVGLTIFAIVAITIYQTFRGGTNLYRRENEVMAENQRIRTFFSKVYLDLVNGIDLADMDTFASEFSGTGMSFITIIDSFSGGNMHKDIAKVEYSLDGDTIKRSCITNDQGFGKENAVRITELLKDVESMNFEYAYLTEETGQENKYEWNSVWEDEKKRRPSLVKMALKIKIWLDKKKENYETVSLEKIFFIPTGVLGPKEA